MLAIQGKLGQAEAYLQEALALSRELKNQSLIAQTFIYQGDDFFYRGDFKSARPLYDQALQEASRGKDRNISLLSKVSLARLDVREGRPQAARSLYQRCLSALIFSPVAVLKAGN